MKTKSLILAATALLAFAAAAKTLEGKVVAVADGDTITVLDAAKTQHKIRLDKIDAPEKKQAFGQKAKQRLSEMVFGKTVKVEWKKKDQYGRILGVVFAGETEVNLEMVKSGFAWHYKYFDKTPAYAEAEADARTSKRGLWADKNPVNPYDWRKSH